MGNLRAECTRLRAADWRGLGGSGQPRRGGLGPQACFADAPGCCPGRGRSGGRGGNFPECGTRFSAPPGGGAGAPFPPRGRAESGARAPRGVWGPARPAPPAATMNGSAVPGPSGSGHLRPGGPSALAPGPPPAPTR